MITQSKTPKVLPDLQKARETTKVRRRKYLSVWRVTNRERLREYQRIWRIDHPDRIKIHREHEYARRRAKRRRLRLRREAQRRRRTIRRALPFGGTV